MSMRTELEIKTAFIFLGDLLKYATVSDSGGEAKQLIQSGYVQVNDDVVVQRKKKVFPGDVIKINLSDEQTFEIEIKSA